MQLMGSKIWIATCTILIGAGVVHAAEDADADTITVYKRAMESEHYFNTSYGYAVFPTVGEGGISSRRKGL